jgi:tight adherence protein B
MSAAVRREVSVTVAGPRSSAVLLALLPVLGIGLGTAMSADPAGILLTTSAGRLLLCGGVLLDALGLFWTDVLIGRAQR